MPVFRTLAAFAALTVLLPSAVHAATYFVPEDRVLIQRADDIVVATAISSTPERTPRGGIVTRSVLRIEDALKGPRRQGEHLVLTELGGRLPDAALVVAGAPVYVPGERYLVFTETKSNSETSTLSLGLGRFAIDGDVITRGGIHGFDPGFEPFSERPRDAAGFLDYIRGIVAQRIDPAPTYFVARSEAAPVVSGGTFTRVSYLMNGDGRWQAPSASIVHHGTQTPAPLDGPASAAQAYGQWNSTATPIDYTSAGADPTALGGLQNPDGKNAILFGDPNGEVPSGAAGFGGYWCTGPCLPYTVGGETFSPITEIDVVIAANFPIGIQSCLNSVVTHEFGHTLGLRHADQNKGNNGPCAPPLHCSTNAIMTATTQCSFDGQLREWDATAVETAYGDGPPACTPPSINAHPTDRTITAGNSTTLTVGATGTTPLSYQWFIGTTGQTSSPTGTNSPSLRVTPSTTTSYWVRVSGQCAPDADSNTATVVVECPTVTLGTPTATPNASNGTVTLSVTGSGGDPALSFQWFEGTSPGTGGTFVGNGSSIIVTPSGPTTYWVRATNSCGNSDVSDLVATAPPPCPTVTVNATVTPNPNRTFTLAASGSGGRPSLAFQWFEGTTPGVGGTFVGNGSSIVVAPPAKTSYWVRASNSCENSGVSALVEVAPCAPAITTEPADQSILTGASATLTVGFEGSGVTVKWYRGTAPDKTNEIGTGAGITVGPLTATTSFWASLSNECGETATRTATINVGACTRPAITAQSETKTVLRNETVALSVTATGTAALHYAWFEGAVDDTSKPVGTDAATFTAGPIAKETQFWVRVTNACGEAKSSAMKVLLQPTKRRVVRH